MKKIIPAGILTCLLCFISLMPHICAAAGTDRPDLPEIPAQAVENKKEEADPEDGIPEEEFSKWISSVSDGKLSGEQLEMLQKAVLEALTKTEQDNKETNTLSGTQEEPADTVGPPAESAVEMPKEETKKDPGELSQYAGMTFDEFLALMPDAVSHDTVVGVKGFSLGGEQQEAGLSGKESDRIITKVNLYGGSGLHLFGITSGMDLSLAAAAAESAGFVNKSGEGSLLVFEAGGTGPAKENSQLTIYSSDGETVNTVTYDLVPGQYF